MFAFLTLPRPLPRNAATQCQLELRSAKICLLRVGRSDGVGVVEFEISIDLSVSCFDAILRSELGPHAASSVGVPGIDRFEATFNTSGRGCCSWTQMPSFTLPAKCSQCELLVVLGWCLPSSSSRRVAIAFSSVLGSKYSVEPWFGSFGPADVLFSPVDMLSLSADMEL